MHLVATGLINFAGPDALIIIGVIACVLLGPKLIKGWSRGIIDTVKEVTKAKKEMTEELNKTVEDAKGVVEEIKKA